MSLLLLPFSFIKFWFYDAPLSIFLFFGSLNRTFLQLFSLPLLARTYFKPWKNEYREGLVGFSIGMGMFIKTFVIIVDTFLFLVLLVLELILFSSFVIFPIVALRLLFI